MTFSSLPHRQRGNLWTALVTGWMVIAAIVFFLARQPFSLVTYLGWLMVVAFLAIWGLCTYRAFALERLQYSLDRDALRVRWGWSTFVIPMQEIRHVHRPGNLRGIPLSPWWHWPARHVWIRQTDGRAWYLFGTRPPEQMWFFCGDDFCVGISPADGEGLLRELNRRRALGVNRALARGWRHPRVARWRFWQDGYALAGWLAGVLFLVLLWGEAARRAELSRPLRLAELGTFTLMVDWLLGAVLYRRERPAALALWWAGSALLATLILGLWTSRI